jgi:DNA anti-recombination protein RmuC
MSAVTPPARNGSSENKPEAVPAFRVPRSAGRRETLEEKLKRRQAEIAARLQAIATHKKEEFREKERRLDRIIGAACRNDESMREDIKAALNKVKSPADREFLKIEGWL